MMKSIKEIIEGPEISNWTGSEKTKSAVAEQVVERYGKSELANYDPLRNMLTFKNWLRLGFAPRKGEHAIKSYIIQEIKNNEGLVIKKICRKINLFYYRQVQELGQKESV